jgi:hypothetical protein
MSHIKLIIGKDIGSIIGKYLLPCEKEVKYNKYYCLKQLIDRTILIKYRYDINYSYCP